MSVESGHGNEGGRKGLSLTALGGIVFLVLAVLTGVEYVVSQEMESNFAPLAVIAFLKAGPILWYFMHVMRAWRSGEGGH